MKRNLLFLVAVALTVISCGRTENAIQTMAVAHRGCWLAEGNEFYINENCPEGVRMAAQYGYPAIECDVKYTLDSVMVLMHDATINRTMRNASDYSVIEEPVKVTEHTFSELTSKYVLASTDPSLRRPLSSLKELLEACKEYGIMPMLHSSVPESYKMAHDILGDRFIAFSGDPVVARARDYSNCLILKDPGWDDASKTISWLKEVGGKGGMSTMKYEMLDAAYIQSMKDAGYEVQASIFPTPHEQRALTDGVTIELSDFFWYQVEGRKACDTFQRKKVTLQSEESLEWSVNAPEFSAVTLNIDFVGSLEITVCGRKYTLNHPSEGPVEKFGLRLYKTDPVITIKATCGPADIRSVRASVYECSSKTNNHHKNG